MSFELKIKTPQGKINRQEALNYLVELKAKVKAGAELLERLGYEENARHLLELNETLDRLRRRL